MAKVAVQAEVRVDRQGRVVIPLSLRRALSIEPDQPLMARVKARFAKVPRKVDLAGELIAERREEARRE